MSIFDNSRDIGDESSTIVVLFNKADIGTERRKGIGCDFHSHICQSINQRRLSRIGKADQTDIGDKLELEFDSFLFPMLPLCTGIGGAIRRTFKTAKFLIKWSEELYLILIKFRHLFVDIFLPGVVRRSKST